MEELTAGHHNDTQEMDLSPLSLVSFMPKRLTSLELERIFSFPRVSNYGALQHVASSEDRSVFRIIPKDSSCDPLYLYLGNSQTGETYFAQKQNLIRLALQDRISFSIPQLVSKGHSWDFQFSVWSEIPGVPLSSIMPSEADQALLQFPEILRSLEEAQRGLTDFDDNLKFEFKGCTDIRSIYGIKFLKEKLIELIDREVLKRPKDLDHIIQLINEHLERRREESQVVLNHCDLNGENIFVDKETRGVSGILDWRDARFCEDLTFDIASLTFFNASQEFSNNLIQHCIERLNYGSKEHLKIGCDMLILAVTYLHLCGEDSNTPLIERFASMGEIGIGIMQAQF